MKDQHPAEARTVSDKHRDVIRPEDFGIPSDLSQRIKNYADFMNARHHPAEAPVAWLERNGLGMVYAPTARAMDLSHGRYGLFVRPDPDVAALRARVAELEQLSDAISRDCNECANQRNEANATIARVRALADEWEEKTAHRCDDSVCHANGAVLTCASELRAALEGSNAD